MPEPCEARRLKVGCATRRRNVFLNLFIFWELFLYLIVLVAWRLAVCQVEILGRVPLVEWFSTPVLRDPLACRSPFMALGQFGGGTHLETALHPERAAFVS